MEIWKDIKDYEGYYQVSNFGKIKNYKNNKYLKQSKNSSGYLKAGLRKNRITKTLYIHRLVAFNFLENPNNYREVNHKDENKTNNNLDNLELCDRKYNLNYGNCQNKKKISNYKPVIQFNENGKIVREYRSIIEAKKYFNIKNSRISNCCRNGQRFAGYYWKYK